MLAYCLKFKKIQKIYIQECYKLKMVEQCYYQNALYVAVKKQDL